MSVLLSGLNREMSQRLSGPGGLYNPGNALGLVGGLGFHLAAQPGTGGVGGAVLAYFAGSGGALAISLAMLIFFWSGEQYHRAWSRGGPPDARLNRRGDVSSGWGALMLGLGLLLTGQPVLAASSGLLHAAGKFGSALPAKVQSALPFGPGLCRGAVVASRLPALALVLVEAEAGTQPLGAAALLTGCYLIWLTADLRLMRG